MAQVDFKVTAWERVEIKDEYVKEVIEKINNRSISSSNDLIEFIEEKGDTFDYGFIPETEEQISLDDNDGYSTIEVSVDKITVHGNGE
jgi:hypothetical protein